MIDRPEDRKCAHPGCACPTDPRSDYCGPECEKAHGRHDTRCSCPHELCQQGQRTTDAKKPSGSYEPNESVHDREKPVLDDWSKSDKH